MEAVSADKGGEPVNLQAYIEERLKERKVLLMTHLIAGYPSLEENWRMLEIMGEVGVDLVELQMPFSEPMADGPTFARANQASLENGTTLEQYFALMRRSTSTFDFPHLMMGYYNTAFRLGDATYCQKLKDNGAVGYILPDLPLEEAEALFALSEQHELHPIQLMTPTNTDARLATIGQHACGFVYVVARRGVTGSKTDIDAEIYEFIARCKKATDVPLAVGFGLTSGADLERLQGKAEIGIVGSELLRVWEQEGEVAYAELLRDLVQGRG